MKKTFLKQLLEMDAMSDMDDMDNMDDVGMSMDMDMMGSNGRNGRNGELDVDVDVDMENDKEKTYADEEHAREHAKKFFARAKQVLNYNKKPAENGDVASMAMKFAKDYHDTIVDEINKMKYNGKEEKFRRPSSPTSQERPGRLTRQGRPEYPPRPTMGADDDMMEV